MSTEHTILYISAGILAAITAVRFILQELTTVVKLFKELTATIRGEPPSHQSQLLDQTGSKRELG